MGLASILGVNFTGFDELLLIFAQLICYANSYYINVVLLGPLPFVIILVVTLMYSRGLLALQLANSTHANAIKNKEGSQYCKRCAVYISNRDHHCIFTGRCVEKANYCYFVSYLFYSYLLSVQTMVTLLSNYELLLEFRSIQIKYYLPLILAFISSAYFIIFTGAMLSSSFRSIFLGIYTVQELKKTKTPKYSNQQLRRMWFSREGRSIIFRDFGANWKAMVGEVTLKRLLLVY